MKWKLIFGVIAVFALIGILGSTGSHQQVAGANTVVTPVTSTIVPTKAPIPTAKPTPTPRPTATPTPTVMWYPPTATPMPSTSVSNTMQTTQTTQTCAGATALCVDGTCSYAVHHQGACSHHGGVAQWYQ